MRQKKRPICTAVLLLLLFFAPAYGFTIQAEAQYTIYETELTQLESSLNTLKKHSEQKQRLLQEQKAQLQKAQEELQRAQAEIKLSKDLNKQTQKSLESARISYNAYEKEAEHKIKVKTCQRNLWAIISGGLLVSMLCK